MGTRAATPVPYACAAIYHTVFFLLLLLLLPPLPSSDMTGGAVPLDTSPAEDMHHLLRVKAA
jgi:hypothetical protein